MPIAARTLNAGAFDDGLERGRGDFLGLERLAGALHHTAHDLIERDERSIGLGADIDLPLPTIGTLESVTVSGREDRVAVDDDLAILFLDGKELVAGALTEGLGRLVFFMLVLRLRRERQRCDDGDAGLDSTLTHWREQPHFIDGLQSDALGNLAKESFGGFDHAVALEV